MEMDPEDITLSEICQAEKDKYCTFSLIREIKKKKKASRYRRRLVIARGRGWKWGHWVKEIEGYKLPDTK